MAEKWQKGDWLLIDAAGPVLLTGLIRDGAWLDRNVTSSGILESLEPSIRLLTTRQSLELHELHGFLYASGPGSTLGLRLAAMVLRGLMKIPRLAHWLGFEYNNLQLACAGQLLSEESSTLQLAAPWRRDRMHRVTFQSGSPPQFLLDAVPPETIESSGLKVVPLGNRSANLTGSFNTLPYPVDRIPAILAAMPSLLTACVSPGPYHAENPEFARWTPRRHTSA